MLQLGTLLQTQGQYQKAIEQYSRIPFENSERAEAQYYIGECYQLLKKDTEARMAYEKFFSIQPRDSDYRIAGLLELAKILSASGEDPRRLLATYEEIAAASRNPEVALMARQKAAELKGGK